MAKLLDGQIAIVTGAGRGIGRAEALALAAHGAKVVVNDPGVERDGTGSNPDVANQTVSEIREAGGVAVANHDSVADWDGAKRLVELALAQFGGLDIVINNAGVVFFKKFEEMTEADYDRLIDINLKGTFNVCRHAIPILKRKNYGRIINTTSNQWAAPFSDSGYAAAKGGVVSLTYALAWEVQDYGITVNAVAPFASTRMLADIDKINGPLLSQGGASARRVKSQEMRTEPEYAAPIFVYLASKHAGNVTGCVFRAGGGKIGLYSHPVEQRSVYQRDPVAPWPIEDLIDVLPQTVLSGSSKPPYF